MSRAILRRRCRKVHHLLDDHFGLLQKKVHLTDAQNSEPLEGAQEPGEEVDEQEGDAPEDQSWDTELPAELAEAVTESDIFVSQAKRHRAEIEKARDFFKRKDPSAQRAEHLQKLKDRFPCMRCGETGHWKDDVKCPKHPKHGGSTGTHLTFLGGAADVLVVEEQPSLLLTAVDVACGISCPECPRPFWMRQPAKRCSRCNGTLHLACARTHQCNSLGTIQLPELTMVAFSSPNFIVVDACCARSVGCEEWAEEITEFYATEHRIELQRAPEHFPLRFGPGETKYSKYALIVPLLWGPHCICLRISIVADKIPLLMSKPAMRQIKALLNFDTMEFFAGQIRHTVNMKDTSTGHVSIPLTHEPQGAEVPASSIAKCIAGEEIAFGLIDYDDPVTSGEIKETTLSICIGRDFDILVTVFHGEKFYDAVSEEVENTQEFFE